MWGCFVRGDLVLQLHAALTGCAELERGHVVLVSDEEVTKYDDIARNLDDFGEKLLLAHEYGANGFLDALRHATHMERGVIRSLRTGLFTFEKHGAIAAY